MGERGGTRELDEGKDGRRRGESGWRGRKEREQDGTWRKRGNEMKEGRGCRERQ